MQRSRSCDSIPYWQNYSHLNDGSTNFPINATNMETTLRDCGMGNTNESSTFPVRPENLESTLRDLEQMKGKKKRFRSRSTSDLKRAKKSRKKSKGVRFDFSDWQRLGCLRRGSRSDQQINKSRCLQKSHDDLRKCCSETFCAKNSKAGQQSLFNKIKKFWHGIVEKKEKPDIEQLRQTEFLSTNSQDDSGCSCAETTDSEISNRELPEPTPMYSYHQYEPEIFKQYLSNNNGSFLSQYHADLHAPVSFSGGEDKAFESQSQSSGAEDFNNKSELYAGQESALMRVEDFNNKSEIYARQESTLTLVPQPESKSEIETDRGLQRKCGCTNFTCTCRNGFGNEKPNKVCTFDIDIASTSCSGSSSDIKENVRSLKRMIAQRRKLQELEIKELKNKLKNLKSCNRKSKKSSESSSSLYTSTTDFDYSTNSNPACSTYSFTTSNECVRTVLDGHPCRTIPNGNWDKPAPPVKRPGMCKCKCSKLKQEYCVESPTWCEPIFQQQKQQQQLPEQQIQEQQELQQQQKLQQQQESQDELTKDDDELLPRRNGLNIFNFSRSSQLKTDYLPTNFEADDPLKPFLEPKKPSLSPINCDKDPTNLLWDQILINTPCNEMNDLNNESIITCYVKMFRKYAADALECRRDPIIDPQNFRYGYPNGKNNKEKTVRKKDDAKVLWTSSNYGDKANEDAKVEAEAAAKAAEAERAVVESEVTDTTTFTTTTTTTTTPATTSEDERKRQKRNGRNEFRPRRKKMFEQVEKHIEYREPVDSFEHDPSSILLAT